MADIDFEAIASRRILYDIPAAVVRQEHSYPAADGSMQPMDVYRRSDRNTSDPLPVILMVFGYADAGMQRIFGRCARDIGSNVSWAELMAASGFAVVTYVNVNPVNDAIAVLEHLRQHGGQLGVDPARIGIWSCSGNVPNALGLLIGSGRGAVKCAALLYGYMLDLDGSTIVSDMSKFGFVTPAAGKTVDDVPADVPVFVARAGRDEMPRLNETVDMFVSHAIARNRPLTLANHHEGPHAFDAVHDSRQTRVVIRQVLSFFSEWLA